MFRRLFSLTVVAVALLALLSTSAAFAQEGDADESDDDAAPAVYGDTEFINALSEYNLLDEWLAASPVSRQAALLQITGGGSYQTQRDGFLQSLDAWAARTEQVRVDLNRIATAADQIAVVRSAVVGVRDALVLDDRLRGAESETLVVIEAALATLSALAVSEADEGPIDDTALISAERQLERIRSEAAAELDALNGAEPAFARSGVESFVGFDDYRVRLLEAEQLLDQARALVGPAQERSERLVRSTLEQIPSLHAARASAATEVAGLSVVTVDAYIRGAERAPCGVDWSLLAGIGSIESNHGRIGGASVSASGRVSTTIFGPLLDGGASSRADADLAALGQDNARGLRANARVRQWPLRPPLVDAWWLTVRARLGIEDVVEPDAQGNGFAVVVDSDNGRLDGNDEWDRAIGPMQFLPETWGRWATDGNGDGVSDPHNLYDAAAAAGRFICHLRDTRGDDPSTYLLGYNDSQSYVRDVRAAAQRVGATLLPDL